MGEGILTQNLTIMNRENYELENACVCLKGKRKTTNINQ